MGAGEDAAAQCAASDKSVRFVVVKSDGDSAGGTPPKCCAQVRAGELRATGAKEEEEKEELGLALEVEGG